MFLCRRWRTNWWRCAGSSILTCPSRPSKCPRSHLHPVIAGAACASRSRRQNSWWKCRRSYPTLRCTGLWSRTWDHPVPPGRGRVDGRGLLGFNPGQSSTAFGGAEHFPASTAEQIVDIPVPRGGRDLLSAASSSGLPGSANQEIFSTFSPWEKSAQLGPHPGSELGADFTSSTPAAELEVFFTDAAGVCGCSSLVVGGNFWARNQKFGGLGDGWNGALVMRQPTDTVKVFPVLLCSRYSHLESGALFPCPCIWQSLFRALGVVYEYENWTFREMTFFVGATLGLPVDTCSASVLW